MIRTQIQDGIAEILLDSPPINGLTDEFLKALMAALRQAGEDPGVRAIVLGSALPGRFCGGLDLRQFRRRTPSQVHVIITQLYSQLHELQSSLLKPVIAAIAGSVRGGGMSIAITCDMIVAAEDATFGYPELDVGLVPAIHYQHLHRIVGRYRAFDLLFTGRVFSAREAMELGLVSRIAPATAVLDKARELARVLASKSPELMRLGKAAFVRAADNGYRQGTGAAVDLICTAFGTADSAEGMAAFDEKRKPRWNPA